MICKLYFPLISFSLQLEWPTCNISLLLSHASYWLKSNRGLIVFFKPFSLFLIPSFQPRAKIIFHIRLRPVLPKSAASFLFDIRKFLVIFSQLVIQNLKKMHGDVFGKKCESASDKLHSALHTFTVAGTPYIMWISGFKLCTLYSSASGAFCSL